MKKIAVAVGLTYAWINFALSGCVESHEVVSARCDAGVNGGE